MFAQDLDPSRNEAAQWLAAGGGQVRLERCERRSFGPCCGLAHASGDQQLGDVHSCAFTCQRRSATAAMSERRERSRTPLWLISTFNLMPRLIASFTASGSSYSPRRESGTSRHAAKIAALNRQQFLLMSLAASRSPMAGFSTMPARNPAESTTQPAKAWMRFSGMLLLRTSEPASNST